MFNLLFFCIFFILARYGTGYLNGGQNNFCILIKCFLHGHLQTGDHIHLIFKALHVTDRLQVNIIIFTPSQTDACTLIAGRRLIDEGHGSGQKPIFGV